MASFALTLGSRPVRSENVLLILDDRDEADEIATELRRHGRHVEVHELSGQSAQG
jgi:ERCC4-type nuclease